MREQTMGESRCFADATSVRRSVTKRGLGKSLIRRRKGGPREKTVATSDMPVDADTVKLEDQLPDRTRGHVTHFKTCPNAAQHGQKLRE